MSTASIKRKIAPILEAYGVRSASVFGSFARGEETASSDVDLLIELKRPIGVYRFVRLQRELSEALGRPVDLVSHRALNQRIAPYVARDLTPVYEVL